MVNSENQTHHQSFQSSKPTPSPMGPFEREAFAQAAKIIRLIGQKFYQAGHTELVPLFALEDFPVQFLSEFENVFGHHITAEVLSHTILQQWRLNLAVLENKTLQIFSQAARFSLNTLAHSHPLSGYAISVSESIKRNSPFNTSSSFENDFAVLEDRYAFLLEKIKDEDFQKKVFYQLYSFEDNERKKLLTQDLIDHQRKISSAILSFFQKIFSDSSLMPSFSDLKPFHSTQRFSELIDRARKSFTEIEVLLQDCQRFYFDPHLKIAFHNFCLIHSHLSDSLTLIESSLLKFYQKWNQVTDERAMKIHNFYFIERFEYQAYLVLEDRKEAKKISERLSHYFSDKGILCHDILSEEISHLSPSLTPEIISQIKLELRLNDKLYPLSVGFRNWVLQKLEHLTPR